MKLDKEDYPEVIAIQDDYKFLQEEIRALEEKLKEKLEKRDALGEKLVNVVGKYLKVGDKIQLDKDTIFSAKMGEAKKVRAIEPLYLDNTITVNIKAGSSVAYKQKNYSLQEIAPYDPNRRYKIFTLSGEELFK